MHPFQALLCILLCMIHQALTTAVNVLLNVFHSVHNSGISKALPFCDLGHGHATQVV